MGKASELDDWLERHPLTPEEKARQKPRPQLRLRREVLYRALSPDVLVKEALDQVAAGGSETLAMLDAATGETAIVVPVERYLELVTSHIRDMQLDEMGLDGRTTPSEDTFLALGVEQVDPTESWLRIPE